MPSNASPVQLKSLDQLAKTIALPGDYSPVRLPTFPALERTSVLQLNATTTVVIPATETRAMLVKQGCSPLWYDFVSSATTQYTWATLYDLGPQINTMAASSEYVIPDGTCTRFTSGNIPKVGTMIATENFSTLPGAIPIGVDDRKRPWTYLPAGYDAQVVFDCGTTAPTPGAQMLVTFEILEPSYNVTAQTVTLTAADNVYAGVLIAGTTRWVRPVAITMVTAFTSTYQVLYVLVASDATFSTASKTLTAGSTVLRALLPAVLTPGIETSTVPWEGARVTAASALFTNVTKALNKEGTVLGGRLLPANVNYFDVTAASFSQLHPTEKYFYGLEEGCYTYLAPATDQTEFRDYVISFYDNVSVAVPDKFADRTYPAYNIDQRAPVNMFVFSDPDGGTSLAVNVDWHVEFRNNSVLWPVGISGITLEALHQAQLALVSAGFFFNNVDHKSILNWVSRGLSHLGAYSKYMHPVIGVGIHTANKFYKDSGLTSASHTPKPTTLRTTTKKSGSGNVRRKKARAVVPRRKASTKKGGKKK